MEKTGELQQKAQALADLAIQNGMQGALQFCAIKDGKCVVDLGYRSGLPVFHAAKFVGRLVGKGDRHVLQPSLRMRASPYTVREATSMRLETSTVPVAIMTLSCRPGRFFGD